MKLIALLTVTAGLCLAGQALVPASYGTATFSDIPAFRQFSNGRFEFRIVGWRTGACMTASDGNNLVSASSAYRVGGGGGDTMIGIGCSKQGQAGTFNLVMAFMGGYNNLVARLCNAENASPDCDINVSTYDDLFFRVTRDAQRAQQRVEIWAADGTKLLTRSYTNNNFNANSQNGGFMHLRSRQDYFIGTGIIGSGLRIAWIRLYNTLTAGAMPKETAFDKEGLLVDYEFEGNNIDAINGTAMAGGGSAYITSPSYSPVIQAAISNAVAGKKMTVDGTQSFTYDGSPLPTATWQWVSGPQRPVIIAPRSLKTDIHGLVAGDHVFSVAFAGYAPKHIPVTVENLDAEGFPIYPTNLYSRAEVRFAKGPYADVQVDVKMPRGGQLSPQVCVSSPCSINIDRRQWDHLFRLNYRNQDGKVMARGNWQRLPVQQVRQPVLHTLNPWHANGNYLGYFTTAASMGFLPPRWRVSVNNAFTLTRNPSGMALWYIDSRGGYSHQMASVRKFAEQRGYQHENFYLHSRVNYGFRNTIGSRYDSNSYTMDQSMGWYELDRFGAMDRHSQTGVYNGAWMVQGDTFTNISDTLYTNKHNTPLNADRYMYLAYLEPFDQIWTTIATARLGGTVVWEYSTGQGTWAPLVVSGETGLERSGAVTFTPPVDWARAVYGSMQTGQYVVRVSVRDAAVWPLISKARTDDLLIYDARLEITSQSASTYTGITSIPNPYTNGKTFMMEISRPGGCTENDAATVAATININGLGEKKIFGSVVTRSGSLPAYAAICQNNWDSSARYRYVFAYDSTLDGGAGAFRIQDRQRGWCDVDTNGNDRITGNEGWTYDPTPGPECLAKFRYQARLLFGWAPNNLSWNLSDVQNGRNTRAEYILWVGESLFNNSQPKYNGIFLDDLGENQPAGNLTIYPTPGTKMITHTELGYMNNAAEIAWISSFLSSFYVQMTAKWPGLHLGGNAEAWSHVRQMDMGLHEWGMNPLTSTNGNWRYTVNPNIYGEEHLDVLGKLLGGEGYDRYAGTNVHNRQAHSIHTFLDTSGGACVSSSCYFWDRGNRGPMLALSMFKLGQQIGNSFFYALTATASYYQNDRFRYRSAVPEGILTTTLSPRPAGSTVDLSSYGTYAGFTADGTYLCIMGSGNRWQTLNVVKSGAQVYTTDTLQYTFAAGDGIYRLRDGNLSSTRPVSADHVYYWDGYFPAQDIDLGQPDTVNGITGDTIAGLTTTKGNRKLQWYTRTAAGEGTAMFADVARRDFTRAIIIASPPGSNFDWSKSQTYSRVLDVKDNDDKPIKLYVLKADGKTGGFCGPAITPDPDGACPGKIQLRSGEGIIAMKEPIE